MSLLQGRDRRQVSYSYPGIEFPRVLFLSFGIETAYICVPVSKIPPTLTERKRRRDSQGVYRTRINRDGRFQVHYSADNGGLLLPIYVPCSFGLRAGVAHTHGLARCPEQTRMCGGTFVIVVTAPNLLRLLECARTAP